MNALHYNIGNIRKHVEKLLKNLNTVCLIKKIYIFTTFFIINSYLKKENQNTTVTSKKASNLNPQDEIKSTI